MSCEPTQDPPFESAVWAAGDTADPQAQGCCPGAGAERAGARLPGRVHVFLFSGKHVQYFRHEVTVNIRFHQKIYQLNET